MKIRYEQTDLIEIFDDISPFNMDRDIKFLHKNKISIDKVLAEIEAKFYFKNYDVIYEKELCNQSKKRILLVKIRIINPQNNKGKASGFRVIAIVNECEEHALIFNLFPKDGARRKDDLTIDEKNKAKCLFVEYIECVDK